MALFRRKGGDRLLAEARKGDPAAMRIVTKAQSEGATELDIREWWNFSQKQRQAVLDSEDVFRLAAYMAATKDGKDSEAAAAEVRRMYPMYGDPADETHTSGDDRPLPHELRGRVDRFRKKHGGAAIRTWMERDGFTNYNAFLRQRILRGEL